MNIGFLCLIFGLGLSANSYYGMATAKGWPVGDVLAPGWSATKVIAGLSCLFSLIRAAQIYYWWASAAVLVGGFLAGFVITAGLRKSAQMPAVVGSWVGLFALPLLPL